MSLLGVDVGTTGCKAATFSTEGELLSYAYDEYDIQRPEPGWAELDPAMVWRKLAYGVRKVATATRSDPIHAVAVSSLGEAMVPVTEDHRILGPSLLSFDKRGTDYIEPLAAAFSADALYRTSGKVLSNDFALPKLLWLRDHARDMYDASYKFLLWGSFVPFMMGAEPKIDYSTADSTLLFDIERKGWSSSIAGFAEIDISKLPDPVPSGTVIGEVSRSAAELLGLSPGLTIVSGAHDQCASALGVGVVSEGIAMCGMGTYLCVILAFRQRPNPEILLSRGLNTEPHAVPGCFAVPLSSYGGVLLKWFRDTFAQLDRDRAVGLGEDIYEILFREIPETPSSVFVIPLFAQTQGAISRLSVETTRGDICKGILEGTVFRARELIESIAPIGNPIREMRAAGGGSKSAAWLHLCADILGLPVYRPRITEASCLGAAIIAGVGCGEFSDFDDGVRSMVRLENRFEPDPGLRSIYDERFGHFKELAASAPCLTHREAGEHRALGKRKVAET